MKNTLLRVARLQNQWNQQQLADFAGVSLSTIERAERGEPIRVDNIERLCICLQRTPDQLGLIKTEDQEVNTKMANVRAKPLPPVVSNGLFRVGKFQGTWFPLDGDGTVEYRLENITTHYISSVEGLPEDLNQRKEKIAQEQQERKEHGLPYAWNGDIYQLDRFVIGREPVHEEMMLDLWFRPSDYYTFLATNKSLDNPEIRAKYLQDPDWFEPVPFFCHSFGIALVVVTKDGY